MKDQIRMTASRTKQHIDANRDLYQGAVGGIFIGAGLMAFFRRPVKINAVVLVKVETK